jgi:hypothetical protein
METPTLETQREKLLKAIKGVVFKLIARRNVLDDLCPEYQRSDAERDERLREVSKLTHQLMGACIELRKIENESPVPLGTKVVLGDNSDHVLMSTVAVLIAARLSDSVDSVFHSRVGKIADICGGSDPCEALKIRDALGHGILRPFLFVSRWEMVRDQWVVGLTESSFQRCIGAQPDEEAVILSHPMAEVLARVRR